MCCDNWGARPQGKEEFLSDCPECGEEAVYNTHWKEFTSTDHCSYSPVVCEHCVYAPCDQSC